MHQLYTELGKTIFRKPARARLWPLISYRYPHEPLEAALKEYGGY